MRDLVMPDPLASFELDADNRIAKQIATRSVTAIIIVGGRFYRQIRITQFGIDGHGRPHASVAGVSVRLIFPRVRSKLSCLWNRMEHPLLPAGPRIEGHHVAGRISH